MRGPEEWPSSESNPADRIRLTGPAATTSFLLQDSATGTYTFGYDNMNRLSSAGVDYSFNSAGTLTVAGGPGIDLAGITNTVGAPSFAVFAKGG